MNSSMLGISGDGNAAQIRNDVSQNLQPVAVQLEASSAFLARPRGRP
jgi:hypothetical protein